MSVALQLLCKYSNMLITAWNVWTQRANSVMHCFCKQGWDEQGGAVLLSAYGRTCSAPAGLSRGLLIAATPSKVQRMHDSYMFCMPCNACFQVIHWGMHDLDGQRPCMCCTCMDHCRDISKGTYEQQCTEEPIISCFYIDMCCIRQYRVPVSHSLHEERMDMQLPEALFTFRGCQGLRLPVQDAHSGQGWEGAGVEVPVTAAAAAATASGSPAPTDCGSSSIAPVQLVCLSVTCHGVLLFVRMATSPTMLLQSQMFTLCSWECMCRVSPRACCQARTCGRPSLRTLLTAHISESR